MAGGGSPTPSTFPSSPRIWMCMRVHCRVRTYLRRERRGESTKLLLLLPSFPSTPFFFFVLLSCPLHVHVVVFVPPPAPPFPFELIEKISVLYVLAFFLGLLDSQLEFRNSLRSPTLQLPLSLLKGKFFLGKSCVQGGGGGVPQSKERNREGRKEGVEKANSADHGQAAILFTPKQEGRGKELRLLEGGGKGGVETPLTLPRHGNALQENTPEHLPERQKKISSSILHPRYAIKKVRYKRNLTLITRSPTILACILHPQLSPLFHPLPYLLQRANSGIYILCTVKHKTRNVGGGFFPARSWMGVGKRGDETCIGKSGNGSGGCLYHPRTARSNDQLPSSAMLHAHTRSRGYGEVHIRRQLAMIKATGANDRGAKSTHGCKRGRVFFLIPPPTPHYHSPFHSSGREGGESRLRRR